MEFEREYYKLKDVVALYKIGGPDEFFEYLKFLDISQFQQNDKAICEKIADFSKNQEMEKLNAEERRYV